MKLSESSSHDAILHLLLALYPSTRSGEVIGIMWWPPKKISIWCPSVCTSVCPLVVSRLRTDWSIFSNFAQLFSMIRYRSVSIFSTIRFVVFELCYFKLFPSPIFYWYVAGITSSNVPLMLYLFLPASAKAGLRVGSLRPSIQLSVCPSVTKWGTC